MDQVHGEARSRAQRELAIDAATAATVGVLILLGVSNAHEIPSRSPGLIGWALGPAAALLLLGQRRRPETALWAMTILLGLYFLAGFPGFGVAIVLVVPVFRVADRRTLVRSLVAPLLLVWAGVASRALIEQEPGTQVTVNAVAETAILVAAGLAGVTARLGRNLTRLRAHEREQAMRQRLTDQRLAIARELHDVLGHQLAAIAIHAGVGREGLPVHPERAAAALDEIRTAAHTGASALATAVAGLRDPDQAPARQPLPQLADLHGLRTVAADAGLRLDLAIDGATAELPPAVELTAVRIVQEALTNTIRHARNARQVHAAVTVTDRAIDIEVRDDGDGVRAAGTSGIGLVGLRERATRLGGWLHAGPRPGGGFAIAARLPLPAGEPRHPADEAPLADDQPPVPTDGSPLRTTGGWP